MGGGFMFAPSSTATPPFSASRSFPTGSQPYHFSDKDSIFGPVPCRVEVEKAILELQRFMSALQNTKTEFEGVHRQIHDQHSQMLQSTGFAKFSEAFTMMQEDPPLQNLVVSISCDKAVWDAIMSNEAIRDLQLSASAGECKDLSEFFQVLPNAGEDVKKMRYDEGAELAELILRWVLSFTKSKILQLVEKFVSLVNDILRPAPMEWPRSDALDEKVRSSLMLSLVILLIVVVTRGHS